jgi:hypothetical protein
MWTELLIKEPTGGAASTLDGKKLKFNRDE